MNINPSLFILPISEIKEFGIENLTYGSLTERGLKTIVNHIKPYITEDIYGFDLGCGDGELIYHLQKLLPESKWEGVEISEHRVSMQKRDVCIWQGDMLLENFRLYNVLHADNLCLNDNIAESLEEKISIEFKGLYITYRYPKNMKFLKKAEYLNTILTETTWTQHPIHLFRL
jgi:folate-dependent tRNA-U54 methylase TrmFO/GidA